MKNFYKGDIVAKKEDTDMKWAVTPGQVFIVIEPIEVYGFVLIERPIINHIKHFFFNLSNVFKYDRNIITKK